jgi:hypothetical protein
VETNKSGSELRLQSGVRMELASSSRGTVYRDRLLLERGASQFEGPQGYRIEAAGLEVHPSVAGAAGLVEMKGNNQVQVAALRGSFQVRKTNGVVVAALPAGRALMFQTEAAGASAAATVVGCLEKVDGHYYLTDDTAGIRVELRGAGLEKLIGTRIEVTGSTMPGTAGAAQVIQVSQTKPLAKRCSSAASVAGAGAGAATAAGAAAGIGTKAVIAGVVVAAAATGTAVGLTRGDEEPGTVSK